MINLANPTDRGIKAMNLPATGQLILDQMRIHYFTANLAFHKGRKSLGYRSV
jgi:hypothetical protein